VSTFTVTNLDDAGVGSLRHAIGAANADISGTPTVIEFAVNGVITLATALPSISRGVTIDGASAPSHVSGGAPVVELDCNGNAGLVFEAGSDGARLIGLAITHAVGNGVTLNAGSITLDGNYIGLNLAGAAAGNAGDGVYVSATSSANLIGFNPTAASGVISNVISGNLGNGISLHGSASNTLVNNHIGTDPSGNVAIANGGNGLWVTAGSNGNTIGGAAFVDTSTGDINDPTGNKGTTAPVFVVPPLGNLVSGNGQSGIRIDANSRNNVLSGNFVGTTADGDGPLGNTLDGIAIHDADDNALIGCTIAENPFVYYNVVSANGANGLHITDSAGITVQANFFGVGADNTSIIGNALNGILVDGASQDVQVGGVIPLGNVSSGNGANGIEVRDTVSGFTTFNTFGGLLAFKGAAPNGNNGLLITATGGNQTVQTNVFSGNLNNGIEIAGDAWGVTVDPNIVGLTTTGEALLPNHNNGIEIDGTAHDNVVGGHQDSVIPQNIFSGNFGYGVAIIGQAHNNQVFNSFVGTDTRGQNAFGNQLGGILIGQDATDNTIGDVASTPTRPVAVLISGNGGNGITLETGTSFTQILNNFIGYDHAGAPVLPNFGEPIMVNGSSDNTISGNTVYACFAAGTRIGTADGDVAVEDLREGDRVMTVDGLVQPVQWIGHRDVDCLRHAAPTKVLPIRIAPHAFGKGLPRRELFLSPDHAIYAEGVLIPVSHLVNGTTVRQIKVKTVTYYHVELPRHAVVFAEGLPAESYLDTDDRSSFANGGGALTLHPQWGRPPGEGARIWDALGYAPLRVTGPEVDRVRHLLASRDRKAAATG